MEGQLFGMIGITLLQLFAIYAIVMERKRIEKITKTMTFRIEVDETKLEKHLTTIAAKLREERDDKDAQETHINHTTAEVIKQVTDALEAISLDKTKDVKIIMSNDNINQGKFIMKLSFRPV